jgi:hypothetical protein
MMIRILLLKPICCSTDMMQQWSSVNAQVGVGSRESPEPARFGDFANAEHAMVEEHVAPQNWSRCDCVVSQPDE